MAPNFDQKLDEPIKVYKVVREDAYGNFFSVSLAENVTINYRMEREVKPYVNYTPIFTFDTLRAASAFKDTIHIILECVTENLYSNNLDKVLPLEAIHNISPERLYDFWCLPLEKEKFGIHFTRHKSKHTLLVSSLIPIRVIDSETIWRELSMEGPQKVYL